MKEFDHNQNEVIDLGKASVETKGAVGFYIDASGGLPKRKFRWDFVINNLAIEIQGGIFKGSRGGHTSGKGYQRD